ncbi:hypothetical protein L798_15421 [Zootermopsis nevadensis]|uniref:Uncharacterized protein n=1 Tax=Zootermopsis nevadensis TaxID=136037 RepID=A0A067QM12_ZOONE|nr:hypothetical protein L798_15421 [Zootermopsis nevadensis]
MKLLVKYVVLVSFLLVIYFRIIDAESELQCTKESDRGNICKKQCAEAEECRCITPPYTACFTGPCLYATCVAKPE